MVTQSHTYIMKLALILVAVVLACSVVADEQTVAKKVMVGNATWWYFLPSDYKHEYGRPCPQIGWHALWREPPTKPAL